MSSATTRKIKGFASIGGEAPYLNPFDVFIVGLDRPATAANWFAHCPRLADVTDASLQDYALQLFNGAVPPPVLVYADGDERGVLEGRRTTRAARIARKMQEDAGVPVANLITIRVFPQRGTPSQLFHINRDSHKKLALTPMQDAKAFLDHYNMTGQDAEKTAAEFGVTTATVKNKLAHFDWSERLQKAVDAGFPVREALKLSKDSREKQDEVLDALEKADALHGARASNSIAAAKKGDKDGVGKDTTRSLSRTFLDRWREVVKKKPVAERPQVDLVAVLTFVMGGAVPRGADEAFKESLVEAGYNPKKAKSEVK